MKAKIMTFHFPCNSGAVLQCMALCEYVKQLGMDVEVIDYRPRYHTNMYAPIRNPFISAAAIFDNCKGNLGYRIYRYIRNLAAMLLTEKDCLKRARILDKYERFVADSLPLTKRYETVEELKRDPPRADFYIAGSDQIWNPVVTNQNVDPAYFLTFGPDSVKRIGYAICEQLSDEQIAKMQMHIEKFRSLSFREKRSADRFLQHHKHACHVADPTFLLEADAYASFEKPVESLPARYILFYGLPTTKKQNGMMETLKQVYRETGLPIVDMNPGNHRIHFAEHIDRVVDPGEFLYLIKNTDVIVTNSFHATVFSVIYEKEFVVSLPDLKKERLIDMLQVLDLQDRIHNDDADSVNLSKIDYAKVTPQVDKLREKARQYLKKSLEC